MYYSTIVHPLCIVYVQCTVYGVYPLCTVYVQCTSYSEHLLCTVYVQCATSMYYICIVYCICKMYYICTPSVYCIGTVYYTLASIYFHVNKVRDFIKMSNATIYVYILLYSDHLSTYCAILLVLFNYTHRLYFHY